MTNLVLSWEHPKDLPGVLNQNHLVLGPVQTPEQLGRPGWVGRTASVRKLWDLVVEVEQKMQH